MSKLGDLVEALFEEHKFVRRIIVIWAMWLISHVVLKFVSLMTTVDVATVSGITTVIGILATVLAFYIRNREIDIQAKDK